MLIKLDDWIIVAMMGFIQIETIKVGTKEFDFAIISRRNKNRAGTRYIVRGVDVDGNVANNVETEQIIDTRHPLNGKGGGEYATSYVQTRGSIPVFWQQLVNLKYKPKIAVVGNEVETVMTFVCRSMS